MKTLKLISSIGLLCSLFYACSKQGATGPSGNNGANGANGVANINVTLYIIYPSYWDSLAFPVPPYTAFVYYINDYAITDSSKDALLVDERDSGSNYFVPVPDPTNTRLGSYSYTNHKILLQYGETFRPTIPMIYKVTVIPPSQMAYHHWNNASEAREALNSNTINKASN